MDSVSQSNAAASPPSPNEASTVTAAAPPIEPRPTREIDLAARLALFGLLIFAFVRQIGPASLNELVYPLLVYGLLTAGYLLASVPVVAREIHRQAELQPLAMALLALVLLLPLMVYARSIPDFDLTELLFTGVLILLPAACAILNEPQLRRADVSLGLITVMLPLVLPFARDTARVNGDPAAMPDGWGIAMRIGAFVLPVLLLLLTTRQQKQRLNFLFVCAALSFWYSVEFDAFPNVSLAPSVEVSYFHFAAIPLFLYMLALAGRFDRLGLSFHPTPRGVSIITSNLGLLAVIAVPLGLVVGFLTPAFQGPTPLEAIARALMIYLLIALPEEILFRGALLTYLQDTLRLDINIIIGISAVIFGMSHLNNPPNAGWTVVLATIAGVFYARAFLATRNVAASAVVHAAVNWIGWLLFNR